MPVGVEYRPLTESGPAAELRAPVELEVVVEVDAAPVLRIALRLIDGRYRITALLAPDGGWLDLEEVRSMGYRDLIAGALAGEVVARTSDGKTYSSSKPMTDPDPLWPVALEYATALALGQPPVVAVANKYSIEHSAAAQRVRRARAKGYLRPTEQGKAR